MDRADYEDELETLKGIVAMLLGLAVLAERLCVLPLPLSLRALVLSILRPAETAARTFAVEQAGGALALPMAAVSGPDGDSRVEAMRLARCFRALACFFCGLRAFAAGRRPFRGGPDRRPAHRALAKARRGRFIEVRRDLAARGAACIDTS